MFTKKEIGAIVISTIVIAFAISLLDWRLFLWAALAVLGVLLVNVLAKKVVSFFLDSDVEVSLWEFSRYGFKRNDYLRKPFVAGAFFPLISKIILFPFKNFVWMASLVFDVKPKVYRSAKRHGLYSFSEMTESHIAMIAASGILANLLFAFLGYLFDYSLFAKLNIFMAFWSIIPISNLDGNKIFFGNKVLWSFVAVLTMVAMCYAIFLI
jgi:hypothetical protein